jgi:hypothetical protein
MDMLTLDELLAKLAETLDPDEILELLDISSEDLLEAFSERVGDKYDRIVEEYYDE